MATTSTLTRWLGPAALGAVLVSGTAAEAPHIFAIIGARIVTPSGPAIESGTIVIRRGLIDAVGPTVAVPADATVIEGQGLSVYPGLIDMGTQIGIDVPPLVPPKDPPTRMEEERWKRRVLLRPDVEAARYIKADGADLTRLASVGITSVLATPGGGAVAGFSALLNVAIPDDEPQIGNLADQRAGRYVVRTPVFLHVRFPERPQGDGYPESLMGVIAFVRQAFLDAGYAQQNSPRSDKTGRGPASGRYDPALELLALALGGRIPVVFDAQEASEIRRALRFAHEFKLDIIVAGGLEADQVIDDLKAQKARVLVNLNFPTRPKSLAPGADEPIRVLRQRAHAPAVAAALERAGVPFAFESGGLKEAADFLKNTSRAVKAGLSKDAALRALTLGAASIAGASDRLGTIEKGKMANLLVTRGKLFDEKTVVAHVFVAGRPIVIEPPSPRSDERPGRH